MLEVEAELATDTVISTEATVHGNSLKSLRSTWGYRLLESDGIFLKMELLLSQ